MRHVLILALLQPHADAVALGALWAGPTCRAAAAPQLLVHELARRRRCPALVMQESAENPAAPEEEVAAAAPAESDEKAALKAEKQKLRNTIANLEIQLKDARGELLAAQDAAMDAGEKGYLLLAANFERFRQQSRLELKSQAGYGSVNGLRPLLPFVEQFDALQAEGADAPIHSFYSGIYKQLTSLLDELKVEAFEPAVGEMLDRSKHLQVSTVASEDVPKGAVVEALTKGYLMDGATLRSAECVISSGPAEEPAAEAETEAEAGAEAGAEEADAEAAPEE